MKIGFDNEKYLALQAEHIRQRMSQFGGKLYLEFGGKLFDDYHASRVLPGFQPDSKIRMLETIRDDVEIVIAICAGDIEKNKTRGDLGIGYDQDVLRLIDVFRGLGFYVGSVVITQYAGQPAADAFIHRLTALGVRSCRHYPIAGYPSDVAHIVSDEVLIALSISAVTNPLAELVLKKLDELRGCDAHFSVILSEEDTKLYNRLGIHVSCEPKYEIKKLYHK